MDRIVLKEFGVFRMNGYDGCWQSGVQEVFKSVHGGVAAGVELGPEGGFL